MTSGPDTSSSGSTGPGRLAFRLAALAFALALVAIHLVPLAR